MSNVITLVNAVLTLPNSKHYWVENGGTLKLAHDHTISVHLFDNEAVMIEHKRHQAPQFFEVKNGFWLRLLVDGGSVQILPKAVATERVLFEVEVQSNRRKWAI